MFDYLVENVYACILALVIGGAQQESERAAKLIPKLEHGERGSCGHEKTMRRLS